MEWGEGSRVYRRLKIYRGQDRQFQREVEMKYHITYRLMHPQSLPVTARATVDAHTHRELEARLARIKRKWQVQGYTIHILRVTDGQPSQSQPSHLYHANKSSLSSASTRR